MANVDQKVEQIRQAIYGKDVRESIASGIEAINAETESTTTRQTKLEGDMATAKQETIQATADAIQATTDAIQATTDAIQATNNTTAATTNAINATVNTNNATTRANEFVNASEVCEPYNNIKTYNKFNKVTHLGSTYQCLVDGTVDIAPDTDNTKWLLIAVKGTDGIGGDMFKNIYDTDDDGIVDKSETITDGTNTYSATNIKNQFDSFTSDLSDMATEINNVISQQGKLTDDTTTIKYKMGIDNGILYFEEVAE